MANKSVPTTKTAPVDRNTAPNKDGTLPHLPDFNEWEKEQTGLAPYWAPRKDGDFMYGCAVAVEDFGSFGKDDTGKRREGTRFMIRAMMPTDCGRGPAVDAQRLIVEEGDYFTMSAWDGLGRHLDFFMTLPFDVPFRAVAVNKSQTQSMKEDGVTPREVWNWDLRVHPTVKPKVDAARRDYDAKMREYAAKQRAVRAVVGA
jgi:hypothetical protein